MDDFNKMRADPMDEVESENKIIRMLDEILNDSEDTERNDLPTPDLKLPNFNIPEILSEAPPCFQEHLQQDIICAIAEHDNILNTLKQNVREKHPTMFKENAPDLSEPNVMNLITEELREWQPLAADFEENATGPAVEPTDVEMEQDMPVSPTPPLNKCGDNCDCAGVPKVLFRFEMIDSHPLLNNRSERQLPKMLLSPPKPDNNPQGEVSELAKKHSNLMKLLQQDLPENQFPTFDPDGYIDLGRFGKYAPGEANHDGDWVDDRRVFAVVGVVKPGSPADIAGLQTDDMVIEFGHLNANNFNNIQQLKNAVAIYVNRPLRIQLKRGRQLLNINVIPQQWEDPGLVGCQIFRHL